MANDLYFGGPSPLLAGAAISAPRTKASAGQQELLGKLHAARDAVIAIRQCLFPDSTSGSERKLREVNNGIIEALTTPAEDLPPSRVRTHVAAFQALVPVVLPTQLAALTVAQDVGAAAIGKAMERYESGKVGEEYMQKLLAGLAGMSGLRLDPGAVTVRERAARLRAALLGQQDRGARWVERGKGAENRVYTGEGGMVYKLCPIREHILDVPKVTNEEPLYPRLCSYPLAGPNGSCPLLERLIHAATIPGMAMADMVGLTPQGEAIFKQIDLGDQEPEMRDVAGWVQKAGGKALSRQAEDPLGQIQGDSSILPMVVLVDGCPILGLDLNPRNCRSFQGKTIPFDVVTRELTPEEIGNHRELAAAFAELDREQALRRVRRMRPLGTPTQSSALQIQR